MSQTGAQDNLQGTISQLMGGTSFKPEDYAKINEKLQIAYLRAGITVLEGYTDALKTALESLEKSGEKTVQKVKVK